MFNSRTKIEFSKLNICHVFGLVFAFTSMSACQMSLEAGDGIAQGDGLATITNTDCKIQVADEFKPYMRCGQLWIAENPKLAESPRISLYFQILDGIDNSSSVGGSHSATLLLNGGPGQSGVEMAPFFKDVGVMESLRAQGDVVFLSQRGSELTETPLKCKKDELSDPLAEECYERLSKEHDLASYSTFQMATDIENFRETFGYQDGLRIFGFSYGGRLALEYAAQYSTHVIRLLLDSPLVPTSNPNYPNGFISNLSLIEDYVCAVGETCESGFDEYFVDSFLRALGWLGANLHIHEDRFGEAKIDSHWLFIQMFAWSYSPEIFSFIPLFIDDLKDIGTSPTDNRLSLSSKDLLLAIRGPSQNVLPSINIATKIAIDCNDTVFENQLAAQFEDRLDLFLDRDATYDYNVHERGKTIFRRLIKSEIETSLDRCEKWKSTDKDMVSRDQLGQVPTLIFSGEFDAVSPSAEAATFADTYAETIQLIQFKLSSHGLSFSQPCAVQPLIDYLTTGHVDEKGVGACLDGLPDLEFFTPNSGLVLNKSRHSLDPLPDRARDDRGSLKEKNPLI